MKHEDKTAKYGNANEFKLMTLVLGHGRVRDPILGPALFLVRAEKAVFVQSL